MANPSTQDSTMSSWHLDPGSRSLPNRDQQPGLAKVKGLSRDQVLTAINKHTSWSDPKKATWVAFVNTHYKPKHWVGIKEEVALDHLKALKRLLTLEHMRLVRRLKTVAVGTVVDKWLHFYIAPNPEPIFVQLTERLLQNSHILLTADSQAGKSTWALALVDELDEKGHTVAYLDLQGIGDNFTSEYVLSCIADELVEDHKDAWGATQQHDVASCAVCTRHTTYSREAQPDEQGSSVDSCRDGGRRGSKHSVSAQEGLAQVVDDLKGRCCVVIEEGDMLEYFPPEQLNLLLKALGSFKGRHPNSMGCVVIGTSLLEDLLLRQPDTSVFTKDDLYVAPPPFDANECENLLQQLLHERHRHIDMPVADLAASIYNFTKGHRGRVGRCLRQLEIMLKHARPVTAQAWAEREANAWALKNPDWLTFT